ncbi:MAG: LamG domain-containing protein [Lactobacillales bacterium]|jgi:hypothetical protein|nr:LamG domain-containing protein [Lactobacillales bacterium]
MTFWLFMITIFVGIFYFAMYPRTDKVNVDKPLGEASVEAFVEQHQAAKDYLYQMMTPPSDLANDSASGGRAKIFPTTRLNSFIPHNSLNTEIRDDTTLSGDGFVSVLICSDATGTTPSTTCDDYTNKYVVTYGTQQSWWLEKDARLEYWRTAILKVTKGSPECGTLYKGPLDTQYKIDNTQSMPKAVPEAVTTVLEGVITGHDSGGGAQLNNLLVCLTPYKLPYVTDSLTLHYDAINNAGFKNITSQNPWYDLHSKNSTGQIIGFTSEPVSDWRAGGLYMHGTNNYIQLPISLYQLGNSFSIDLVLKMEDVTHPGLFGSTGTPQLLGGIYDTDSKTISFGFTGSTQLKIPVGAFRYNPVAGSAYPEGAPRTITLTYTVENLSSGGMHKLYINGNLIAQDHLGINLTLPGTLLEIGRVGAETNTFKGYIYNIKVYTNKVLNEEEIKKNFDVNRRRFGATKKGSSQDY